MTASGVRQDTSSQFCALICESVTLEEHSSAEDLICHWYVSVPSGGSAHCQSPAFRPGNVRVPTHLNWASFLITDKDVDAEVDLRITISTLDGRHLGVRFANLASYAEEDAFKVHQVPLQHVDGTFATIRLHVAKQVRWTPSTHSRRSLQTCSFIHADQDPQAMLVSNHILAETPDGPPLVCTTSDTTDPELSALAADLELMWRQRATPALLPPECTAGELLECGICFEPLYLNPGILMGAQGLRACRHFFCTTCATQSLSATAHSLCPLCRAPFVKVGALPKPDAEPKNFFRLACVPEARQGGGGGTGNGITDLLLTKIDAFHATCALLPINMASFEHRFNKLWSSWAGCTSPTRKCLGHKTKISEEDFLKKEGMLYWLTCHVHELEAEKRKGAPPVLTDKTKELWFRHFDYNEDGALSFVEVLRGLTKTLGATPGAASMDEQPLLTRVASTENRQIRDVLQFLWDAEKWKDGLTLADFAGEGGLSQLLLDAVPQLSI